MDTALNTSSAELHYRICPFCEQNCGTEVTIDRASDSVVTVRGDKADPLSKGFICPKAYALKDLLRHHRRQSASIQRQFPDCARHTAPASRDTGA